MKAKSQILKWRSRKSWLADIDKYAGNILGTKLRKQLKDARPSGCWSDDVSWLPDPGIVADFKVRLLDYYTHVKAFHACRPTSVREYYDRGMLGQRESTIVETFRTYFSDVDPRRLDAAIAEMAPRGSSERGKIYFVCDAAELVDHCGHYLIQGSEYLIGLAACLCSQRFSTEDFLLRLRKYGIPTIFEADIPLSYVSGPLLDAFCRSIIAEWSKVAVGSKSGGADEMCVILHRNLEPQYIKAHWHPREIPDPHALQTPYLTPQLKCDHCPGGLPRANR